MQNNFKEKLIRCRLIAKELLVELLKKENNREHEIEINNYLDEKKLNGISTLQELWDAYGFSDKNLETLNLCNLNHIDTFNASYKVMEKWVEILFEGKIQFKTYFDREIEKRIRIREHAAKRGIHGLNLNVDFSNIAIYFDLNNDFTKLTETIRNKEQNDLIKTRYATRTNAELVELLSCISLADFCSGSNSVLQKWIAEAEGYPDQLISEKLKTLHLFINSIDVSIATGKNYPILIYSRILRSTLQTKMHETLELIDWLFEGKSDGLDSEFEDLIGYCKEKYQ